MKECAPGGSVSRRENRCDNKHREEHEKLAVVPYEAWVARVGVRWYRDDSHRRPVHAQVARIIALRKT